MPNYHLFDTKIKKHLVSVYQHDETKLFQLMIREGDGFDYINDDWKYPIYQVDDIKTINQCLGLAKEYLK